MSEARLVPLSSVYQKWQTENTEDSMGVAIVHSFIYLYYNIYVSYWEIGTGLDTGMILMYSHNDTTNQSRFHPIVSQRLG